MGGGGATTSQVQPPGVIFRSKNVKKMWKKKGKLNRIANRVRYATQEFTS